MPVHHCIANPCPVCSQRAPWVKTEPVTYKLREFLQSDTFMTWNEAINHANMLAAGGWAKSKPLVERGFGYWSVTWEPR